MIVIAYLFPKLQNVKELVKPLSRKRRFRTSFDNQLVNVCQTLVKSAWEITYQIFWSLWREITSKMSPLLNFKILGVFVNTLTAKDMYPVGDCENLQFLIHMQLSWKRRNFHHSLFYLWNLHQVLKIFKKKMIVIADVFPRLQTVKTWSADSLKSAVSEHSLAVNMLKDP